MILHSITPYVVGSFCGLFVFYFGCRAFGASENLYWVALIFAIWTGSDARRIRDRMFGPEWFNGEVPIRRWFGVFVRLTVIHVGGLSCVAIGPVIGLLSGIPWYIPTLVALAGYVLARLYLVSPYYWSRFKFRRGRSLLGPREKSRQLLKLAARNGNATVFWGGNQVPLARDPIHYCIIGMTGSGKTVTQRLLMQSVLPLIRPGSDWRALIYDPKQDMISILHGMGLEATIAILNPFDARSASWDMAKDITSPAAALQAAAILMPVEDGPNRYFSAAAQHLVAGVMTSFIRSQRHWAFRDIILATKRPDHLRAVLNNTSDSALLAAQYLNVEPTASNILSTIASKMMLYEPIAALWHRSEQVGRSVSLEEWAQGEFILLFGNDETLRVPLNAINRVLFNRAGQLLQSPTQSTARRSWVFLDELAMAGKLDGLDALLTRGRSPFGISVVLGFQDIDSLKAPSLYGEHIANVIVGQCAAKAILRLDSERTARWASGAIGEVEAYESSVSRTRNNKGEGSYTVNEQLTKREAIMPSEILSMPLPTNGVMEGVFMHPDIGAYRDRFTFKSLLCRPAEVPNFISRPTEEQYLQPWDDDDIDRLGLQIPEGPSSPRTPANGPSYSPLDDIPRLTR